MLNRKFTCVRLSHPYLTWSIHAFDHNVHHHGPCAAAACGSLKPLPAERLRGTFPHLSYSMKLALLLGTTEGPTLISLAASHPHTVGVFAAHVVGQFEFRQKIGSGSWISQPIAARTNCTRSSTESRG